MIKLLDLASEIEASGVFNMKAIENNYRYYPFYDDLIIYSKKMNKAENCGITHFSWYADITKDEAIDFLEKKYVTYLNKGLKFQK